ncbi:reductase EvaE/reductase VcaE [Haloactinopolyspora alba]|uniref:Reductase EvaE/reductase VcaE n=1 Tax=Haloactinopolyspora alba TaxID=648780 RepID=A0A2P8E911_9ACTN|nr:NAD-dependent epimerase/dehydratase [Haloactinopolyspora alba]PSL05980.1 reductase EvaE/reductase VcaE [Haloactinopolyspora alba]
MTATSATPRRPGEDARPQITVLGATGFVGSAVLARLARRDVRLRAVARAAAVPPAAAAAGIEVVTADLTDREAMAAAVKGSDAVVHLLLSEGGWRAADSDGAERVNVGVMRELTEVLRADSGHEAPPVLVYAGAASQVGVPPREPLDGSEHDHPATVYDRQKVAAEQALVQATEAGWVRGVSLRLPTVFGTSPGGADRGVVTAMVRRALAGEPLTMWHDGTVRRDLVDVSDIACAFEAALDHADGLAGRHWLIGAGRGDPLGRVFELIAQVVADRAGTGAVPVVSVPPPEHAPETDFRSVTIDSTRFRAVTGWRPRISLREGIDRLVTDLTWHDDETTRRQ